MDHALATDGFGQPGEPREAARGDVLAFLPDFSPQRATTFRGGVIHSNRPPGNESFVAEDHYVTVFLSSVTRGAAALNGERMRPFEATAGTIGIVPAGVEGAASWETWRESVTVVIARESLEELAAQERSRSTELWAPQSRIVDPWALHMAKLLKAELLTGTFNEFYVDSLITLFGVHLLRNFTETVGQKYGGSGGLSPLNKRRAREYLSANFDARVTVAELAAECQLSPSHFIQAFARTFGVRPHEYLTELRLDHAAHLLAQSDATIAEIAYQSGFSSQSHLTSTMRRHRGLTPARLRQTARE